VVSAYYDLELQEHARHECILAYLVKPVGPEDPGPAVSLAWWRFGLFGLFQGPRPEAGDRAQAPDEGKAPGATASLGNVGSGS
jgi:hypothetical protein